MKSRSSYYRYYYDEEWEGQEGRKRFRHNGSSVYSRKCHDCGKPTNDYRCPKCWARIRGDSVSSYSDVDTEPYAVSLFSH